MALSGFGPAPVSRMLIVTPFAAWPPQSPSNVHSSSCLKQLLYSQGRQALQFRVILYLKYMCQLVSWVWYIRVSFPDSCKMVLIIYHETKSWLLIYKDSRNIESKSNKKTALWQLFSIFFIFWKKCLVWGYSKIVLNIIRCLLDFYNFILC